ncbi:MAG: FAD synthase [Methanomicrobiaceae archaeon]|nr:FAD synthase [Methanomicrobiaceae archaeon]
MRRVVATGTFDILHPGHVYYLEASRALGDELHVIVARDANVKHKPAPVIPESQRLRMVQALRVVDHARLGDEHDMFVPIEAIGPDVITIGFNQHFDVEKLESMLRTRGIDAEVARIGAFQGKGYCSSRTIMETIIKKRCFEGRLQK